ncbi:MAG: hypothetical protein CL696_13850 [Chloroflexi bacterium]|jgi:vacuolar-type H+-ATPase subunit H|nr:hypothetical protein [Chloroflexota bacterium]MDP6497302.1 hypothetical protein [Dehalococcoidia bacterium]MQG10748.1 hypothetical protein [SAR202 cluster bacterium]MQG54536.1 hypothetical protein [SAR202 cluster bacterium]|tara:strand:+ start:2156 stop:2998 length:843 start_codon:yes stop_codon:yes gene_type:complete
MAENNQESQGLDGNTQPEASGDKQSMLLKLAERTVVQAEALAQEITDHARQESEAAGAMIIAEASEKAKAEAQQTIDSAKRHSETMASEAASEALAESEKTLGNARSESEKMLSRAQSDSEKLVNKAKEDSEKLLTNAKSDSEADLRSANNQAQEILAKARQEAQSIISASQTRSASAESKARLQAEFIIRQTTQNVSEGIRASVLEICNNLLPTVEGMGTSAPAVLNADEADSAVATETPMLESADSDDEHSPATNGVDSRSSDKPKSKSKASKKGIAA